MGLIAGLVFVGVFAVIALPLIGSALSPSRSARQAIGHAGLGDQAGEPETAPAQKTEPAQERGAQQHSLAEQKAAEIRD